MAATAAPISLLALLLVVVLVLLLSPPAAAQLPATTSSPLPPTYALDWARVPDANSTGASDDGGGKDLEGGCICALINATCTPGCCCDPNCPPAAVGRFRASAGGCLPSGPPPAQLDYCRPADAFARVNLPSGDFFRIERRAADDDLLTQLLCVAADNNPSLGAAYPGEREEER